MFSHIFIANVSFQDIRDQTEPWKGTRDLPALTDSFICSDQDSTGSREQIILPTTNLTCPAQAVALTINEMID